MKRFSILREPCTIGFAENVTLNLFQPIEGQLNRRRLLHRRGPDKGGVNEILKIIEKNSSLRISFGWSFESTEIYEDLMNECTEQVAIKYNIHAGNMMSDTRCDWLGFVPFNVFDAEKYADMSVTSLIIFNNELIDFQTEVVKFISTHKHFLDHSLVRNDEYRFRYFKSIRKDPVALVDAFHYYLDAIKDTTGVNTLSKSLIEEFIGCHYLHHPETFFELVNFYTLKGSIHD